MSVVRRLIASWSDNTLASLLPDRDACREYASDGQTRALVRALDGRPPANPFVPGTTEMPNSLKGKIGPGGWID